MRVASSVAEWRCVRATRGARATKSAAGDSGATATEALATAAPPAARRRALPRQPAVVLVHRTALIHCLRHVWLASTPSYYVHTSNIINCNTR